MRRRAFTLIELLVVIAILALLAALLVPAMKSALERGRQSLCLSNIRGAGLSLQLFAGDRDGDFPVSYVAASWPGKTAEDARHWVGALLTGDYTMVDSMICPSHPPAGGVPPGQEWLLAYMTFGMGGQYNPDWAIRGEDGWHPSISEVLLDSIHLAPPSWVYDLAEVQGFPQYFLLSKRYNLAYPLRIHFRHQGKANVLFLDLHAASADPNFEVAEYYQYPEYHTGPLQDFYATLVEQ